MDKKIKIVFDTNVWVSIFMKKTLGKEFSRIFENEKIQIFVSEQIMKEISRVFMYPKISELLGLSGVSIREILENIVRNSISVKPIHILNIIKEDPEDNRILECALHTKADFIVSGDKHLLKLKKFKNVKIITPREFLDIIE